MAAAESSRVPEGARPRPAAGRRSPRGPELSSPLGGTRMGAMRVSAARTAAGLWLALMAPTATAGVRLELSSELRDGGAGAAPVPEHFLGWIDGGRRPARPTPPRGALAG